MTSQWYPRSWSVRTNPYLPRAFSDADLALMRRIDPLHLEHPFSGARMLMLRREGLVAGRKHVSTLMRRMGIEALYRKPNTSRKHAAHKVWPYLLRNRKIERSDQVWTLDTTYVPMARLRISDGRSRLGEPPCWRIGYLRQWRPLRSQSPISADPLNAHESQS
jgi:transposase InsO family protein